MLKTCVKYIWLAALHNTRWNIHSLPGAVGEGISSSSDTFIYKWKSPGAPTWLFWGLLCWTPTLGWCHDASHARAMVCLLGLGHSGPTPRMGEAPPATPTAREDTWRKEEVLLSSWGRTTVLLQLLYHCLKNLFKYLSDLLLITCIHFYFKWHIGPTRSRLGVIV